MSAIIDFLLGLGELIVSLIAFVFGMIEDLLYIVALLGSIIVKIRAMIGWLPSACITLTVTLFAVVLIYKLLGREG